MFFPGRYLHNLKTIHGDLKPSNILLTRNCRALVCDFGISQFIQGIQRADCLGRVSRWLDDPSTDGSSFTTTEDSWSSASTESSPTNNSEMNDSASTGGSIASNEEDAARREAVKKARAKIEKINARTIEKYRWMAPEALTHFYHEGYFLYTSDVWRWADCTPSYPVATCTG